MKKKILNCLFVLALLSIASPATSEPNVQIEREFYNIYPSRKKDLGREMQQRSPVVFDGKKFNGLTTWRVNWKFNWHSPNENCKINGVSTELQVKYTMPQIPDTYGVASQVRSAFNRYYVALLAHEEGHKDSGLFASREIEQELLSMKSFKDCSQLRETANQKARQIIQKYQQRDRNYDRRTEHGRLQNVDIDNFI